MLFAFCIGSAGFHQFNLNSERYLQKKLLILVYIRCLHGRGRRLDKQCGFSNVKVNKILGLLQNLFINNCHCLILAFDTCFRCLFQMNYKAGCVFFFLAFFSVLHPPRHANGGVKSMTPNSNPAPLLPLISFPQVSAKTAY